MIKFICLVSFLLATLFVFSQTKGKIIVYSTSGGVEMKLGKIVKPIKSYDVLSPGAVLSFNKNAKLYFIGPDNKLYDFAKSGSFTVAKITGSTVGKTSGEISKAMSLIIHHFIEKGKSYHKKTSFSSAGVVTRGGEGNMFLFPMNKSIIYAERNCRPIFNAALFTDSSVMIQLSLIINDSLRSTYQLKKGDGFALPNDISSKDEIYIQLENKQKIEKIKLIVAKDQKLNSIENDIKEIENQFIVSNQLGLLMAKALYFESKGFYFDALGCYDQMISQSNNNEDFIAQRNAFLNDIIIQ